MERNESGGLSRSTATFFADDSDYIGAERLTHKTGESFGYGSVCIREQERQYEHAS